MRFAYYLTYNMVSSLSDRRISAAGELEVCPFSFKICTGAYLIDRLYQSMS